MGLPQTTMSGPSVTPKRIAFCKAKPMLFLAPFSLAVVTPEFKKSFALCVAGIRRFSSASVTMSSPGVQSPGAIMCV